MADKTDKANQAAEAPAELRVDQVDQGSPAALEEALSDPNTQMQAEVDKPVGVGENLYFFPDLQKSVVAKSMEEAVAAVQVELDALKNEGNK